MVNSNYSICCVLLAGLVCLFCLLLGLGFTTTSGNYWFTIFNDYGATFSLLFIVLLEVIAVSYIYGIKRFVFYYMEITPFVRSFGFILNVFPTELNKIGFHYVIFAFKVWKRHRRHAGSSTQLVLENYVGRSQSSSPYLSLHFLYYQLYPGWGTHLPSMEQRNGKLLHFSCPLLSLENTAF